MNFEEALMHTPVLAEVDRLRAELRQRLAGWIQNTELFPKCQILAFSVPSKVDRPLIDLYQGY